MIGYKNTVHHGWKTASQGRVLNPYPMGSSAWEEFQLGVRRYNAGEPWEGKKRGDEVRALR